MKFPSIMARMARVPPQPGHANPVCLRNMQPGDTSPNTYDDQAGFR